jgi:nitrogen fixation-related uncharacterized protein
MASSSVFLLMWIVFTVVALLGISAVFWWAVRTRQFANQRRARYLALSSEIPAETDQDHDKNGENEPPQRNPECSI